MYLTISYDTDEVVWKLSANQPLVIDAVKRWKAITNNPYEFSLTGYNQADFSFSIDLDPLVPTKALTPIDVTDIELTSKTSWHQLSIPISVILKKYNLRHISESFNEGLPELIGPPVTGSVILDNIYCEFDMYTEYRDSWSLTDLDGDAMSFIKNNIKTILGYGYKYGEIIDHIKKSYVHLGDLITDPETFRQLLLSNRPITKVMVHN